MLRKEREKVIEVCLNLFEEGLTNGTAGNVSIFNREKKLVAISPTGIPYTKLKPDDISVVDLEGKVLQGKDPSSELEMHLIFYRNRENINAVIHAHTEYSTALACLRKSLPAINYMIALTGDKEVRCAEYASYGTKELAENAFKAAGNSKAVLLANHGITTVGENTEVAFSILSQVEYLAKLYLLGSSAGEPIVLDEKEIFSMVERFKEYGQRIK